MADWAWDPRSGKYRDLATGRYMARDQVLALAQQSLDAAASVTDRIGSLAASGGLSPADFGLVAREEIKGEYIRQYLLGIGGRDQMKPSDWGTVGRQLRDQYQYLDGFIKDVADGKLTEAQIQARFRLYIDGAHQSYEKAAQKSAKKAGFTEVYWMVDTSAENCDVCLAHQADGWQPIDDLEERPGDGNSPCLGNCACSLLYRNPESGETY